uniref:Ubiquitin carboxyl-terminal hydrolase n=1 Tax=Vitis vinifera TaxID=29760 RepID=F6I1Y1_VITVI|eukprot:XP_003634989.1 PREDICTED: ubiquitin carboxyl-terminal hydrolase 23 isoform X2 [Vitis vinifera]
MAEALISNPEANAQENGPSASPHPSSAGSLFHRRIDFHLTRKPYSGFTNGSGGFRLETLNPTTDPKRSGHSTGPAASSGKKQDGSDHVENGLDPELSIGITVRRIGAGLENLGNTCFLNSVLQCLTYTEPLAAYLQSGKHQNSCHIAGFCALCAIQKHVSRALQSTGRILAPKDLVSNLRCISRNFRNARQEDAHEYMVNLLETMHKCCLPSGVPSESPSAYEKSLVHKIFGGLLRSQVKCMQCSYCSNKFDPFLDLSLEIFKADSLHKALMHFTATEQLDGGERQYQCQRCKQKVKALKQLTVHKAPYVLTIHLKRFGAHDPGQKIDKKVHFGPTMDLKPFVSGSYEENLKYTLYGVLVHAGWSTHSGHYYCFVRTSTGMWYSLDDNRVVQVSERTVLDQKAYMLFYVRDRKNFTPKKSIDVVQKQNLVASAIAKKTYSSVSQGLKETIQNGPVEKSLRGVVASAAVTKNDVSNVGLSKESLSKEASAPKSSRFSSECLALKNGPMSEPSPNVALSKQQVKGPPVLNPTLEKSMPPSAPSVKGSSDCLALKKGPMSKPSPNVALSKQRVKGPPVLNPTLEKSMPPSALSVKGSGITNLGNAIAATTSAKFNERSEDEISKKDQGILDVIQANCIGSQNSAADKPDSGKTSPKVSIISNADETLDKVEPVKLPNGPSGENFQVDSMPKGSAAGDSLIEKADDGGQKLSTKTVEFSSPSSMMNGSIHMKTLDCKPHRKFKKKNMKCRMRSMHLVSNNLFRASLSLRKKKKHRRSKRHTSDIKNLTQEHLLEAGCLSVGQGPSTSDKTQTTSVGPTNRWGKRVKHGTKKGDKRTAGKDVKTSNSECVMDTMDVEFRDRIGEEGAMLATDKEPQKSSISVAKQRDAQRSDSLNDSKRDQMQNGLMSMLTRGLDETIVARWDEIEWPSNRVMESRSVEGVTIGYVPDEWDEEYDRGKRKKVRSSNGSFGGPNPFQEIATKKAHFKKAKKDRSSSGNQPFRI